MTDNNRQIEAVVDALNSIQAELKSLNLAVAKLAAAQSAKPAGPGRPSAPAYGERSEEFAPKRPSFRPGGKGPVRGGSKFGARSSSSPSRSSASAPPRKKGDGYPKKPR